MTVVLAQGFCRLIDPFGEYTDGQRSSVLKTLASNFPDFQYVGCMREVAGDTVLTVQSSSRPGEIEVYLTSPDDSVAPEEVELFQELRLLADRSVDLTSNDWGVLSGEELIVPSDLDLRVSVTVGERQFRAVSSAAAFHRFDDESASLLDFPASVREANELIQAASELGLILSIQ